MRDLNHDFKQLGQRNRDGSFQTQHDRESILALVANQRKVLMRFLKVPAEIPSACQRCTRCSTCFVRMPCARRCRKPPSANWLATRLRMFSRSCCVANEPSRLRWPSCLKS